MRGSRWLIGWAVWIVAWVTTWIVAAGPAGPLQAAFTKHLQGEATSPAWHVAFSSYADSAVADLRSSGPNDLWAVGDNAYTLHWDGKNWQYVTGFPMISGVANVNFTRVFAGRPDDVFVMGKANFVSGDVRNLLAHWNGKIWSYVKDPSSAAALNQISFVPQSHEAWGITSDYSANQQLVNTQHWDGKGWHRIVAPRVCSNGCTYTYTGIEAESSTSAYVIGVQQKFQAYTAFVEHWDGKKWSLQSAPTGSLPFSLKLSHGHLWQTNGQTGDLEYWDGQQWKQIPLSSQVRIDDPNTLLLLSDTDIWGIGHLNSKATGDSKALHWDGKNWSEVPIAQVSGYNPGSLTKLTDVPGTNELWGVGMLSNRSLLIEHYR